VVATGFATRFLGNGQAGSHLGCHDGDCSKGLPYKNQHSDKQTATPNRQKKARSGETAGFFS